MMNKLCNVKNISFSYDKSAGKNKMILDDISFSVSKNEIVGILGKNGCGKSTLLNIISGFIVAQKGEVCIKGKNVCQAGKKAKDFSLRERAKSISYIQQKSLNIPSYYQVEDFILEGLRPFRPFGIYKEEDYAYLDNIMKECNLQYFNGRLVNELSGGEQQRCFFAREIMKKADLFLFDEPCSAMDIKYQKEFFKLAEKTKKQNGNSILITIHDINLAVQNCDRIILLYEGRILYDGPSDEISCEVLSKAFDVKVSMEKQYSKKYFYY